MKKTVVHLTAAHTSFDCRIFYKEALSLSKRYKVYILAPGYDGKVLDMGRNLFNEGVYNDISLLAYGILTKQDLIYKIARRLIRALRLHDFVLFKSIHKKLYNNDIIPDYIHFHEVDLLPIAVKLKKIYNCKIIFDSHEMFFVYPLDQKKYPFSHIYSYLSLLKMKKYFKYLDATISVNNLIKALHVTLNPYIPHKVIYNASIFNKKRAPRNGKRIVLIHEGTLDFSRGFTLMCDLFTDSWFKENAELKILGKIGGMEKEYLNKRSEKKPWLKNLIYDTGWVDYLSVPEHLTGDIGLIFMEPSFNNLLAGPPNKLFNYITAQIPILSFEIPASADLIRQYNIGLIADRNLEDTKRKIKSIIADYEKYLENLKNAEKELSWNAEEKKLLRLYNEELYEEVVN